MRWSTLFAVGLMALVVTSAAPAAADFASDIEPIFHNRCYGCHGPSQQMNGLRLDQKDAALEGGYSGAVILPGNSGASKLIERVTSDKEGFRMPPGDSPVSANEIEILRQWIDQGAAWEESPTPAPAKLSEKEKHWSFQPVGRPPLPPVNDPSWARNAIDRFVLAKLDAEGIKPSPEAEKTTLIRRLYFDLIGLPPSPAEVSAFINDPSDRAYDKVVGRLLQSRHYGEKWASHWLDAARYADSDGYEKDLIRPHAWRWRNWVIDALNGDMPFDQFTIEQIAGDLLPNATVEQRVATGLLRNGTKNREAGVKAGEKRFEETIDRINTLSTVWLGLTVGCAQCHDHKYDPLKQQEFYQMYAFFNNTVERDIESPLPGERGPLLRALPGYYAKRRKILEEAGIPELQARWHKNIIAAMDHPGLNTDWDFSVTAWRGGNDRADWTIRADPGELTQLERDKITDWFLRSIGPDYTKNEEIKKRIEKTRDEIQELEKSLPARTRAYTMIERSQPVPTHVALRGDYQAPGIEVQPMTPAVLPPLDPGDKHPRLLLAEWLVSKKNPLTPRVTVNRMWQEFFGRGIVRTAEDFGTQGEPPSHPELLDWLASEFIARGWSQKEMHRLIVTSATYRQSSRARPDAGEKDPANRLLARQNRLRLPAELVRDNALQVSGLLYPEIGGKSVFPPQPAGVGELGYSKKTWVVSTGPERYRRGIYIHFQRTTPYPMLMNFDAPNTLTTAPRRDRSNTALQALNLLNDPVFFEAAQGLAARVLAEAPGDEFSDRLTYVYRLCLSRKPSSREADRLSTYFEQQRKIFLADHRARTEAASFHAPNAEPEEAAAWVSVSRALMNLDEFITRE